MFDAKGVHLHSQIAGATMIGDPARLRQIVNNLLSNALKHTPEHGQVDVVMTVSDSEATLKIEDNGGGIPADFLPRVFDRFAQADPFITRVQGGLGIGLAITRDLVSLHGGRIEAKSAGIGKGATFTIKLPLAPASSGDPEWSTPYLMEPPA
jgi:signal transduction histidine kinase